MEVADIYVIHALTLTNLWCFEWVLRMKNLRNHRRPRLWTPVIFFGGCFRLRKFTIVFAVNWSDVRGLTFSGDGLLYMRCLGLYNTSERPIITRQSGQLSLFVVVLRPDWQTFLSCQCAFTPEHPCRTLFLVTNVRYIVVQQRGSVYYFDRVDILYNFVDMDPLFPKIQCTYEGTYLRFVQSHDLTRDNPSVPSTQQSATSTNTSSNLRTADRN